jgi:hypothetical protein
METKAARVDAGLEYGERATVAEGDAAIVRGHRRGRSGESATTAL